MTAQLPEPTGAESGAGSRVNPGALKRDAITLIVTQYGSAALGFLLTVWVTRVLGVVEYGRAALVFAFPTLVIQVSSTKASLVVVRFIAAAWSRGDAAAVHSAFRAGLVADSLIAAAAAGIVIVSAPFIAGVVYNEPSLGPWMVAVAIGTVICSPVGPCRSLLVSVDKRSVMGVLQVTESLAMAVIFAITLQVSSSFVALVVAQTAAQAFDGLLHLFVCERIARREGWISLLDRADPTVGPRMRELRFDFGWNWGIVSANGALVQLPALILGWRLGPMTAGLFKIASTVATVATYAESGLARIAYPELAKRSTWTRSQALTLTRRVGVPIAVLVSVAAPIAYWLTPTVFGADFVDARGPIAVLLLASGASALAFWATPNLLAQGRLKSLFFANVLLLAVVVAASYLPESARQLTAMCVVVLLARVAFTAWIARTSLRGDNRTMEPTRVVQ